MCHNNIPNRKLKGKCQLSSWKQTIRKNTDCKTACSNEQITQVSGVNYGTKLVHLWKSTNKCWKQSTDLHQLHFVIVMFSHKSHTICWSLKAYFTGFSNISGLTPVRPALNQLYLKTSTNLGDRNCSCTNACNFRALFLWPTTTSISCKRTKSSTWRQ